MTETTINIDAGGTFTDGFFTVGDRSVTAKVPTTPHDLTRCFLDCIERGSEQLDADPVGLLSDADTVRFSTTVGTNTIIEATGPKLGVLVTAGHETDCYAPADAPGLADRFVDPELIAGVDERVTSDGEVLEEPDPEAVASAVKRLQEDGARLIAIAFANGATNPANERAAKRAIEEAYPRHYLGAVPTLAAVEVTDRPDDYRRLNTVAANAYIHRAMKTSLYRAEDEVRERGYDRPLFVGHSHGGVARVAKTVALNTYNSGPAAGVLGGAVLSDLYDTDLVTADMGGTSIDISVVSDGTPARRLSPAIDDLPTHLPAIDVTTAGAGGGSIAAVEDGRLSVGPESAGANPGPACFGRGGTEPTVTDADVVLGRVNPDYFLGGDYDLDAERAREAVGEIAADLGTDADAEAAARRIVERAEANIAEAIGDLTDGVETLLSYGGAGPTHAAGVAARLDVDRVFVSPYSSVFSAFGESTMDVHHTYTRALARVDDPEAALDAMREEATRDMRAEGFDPAEIAFTPDLLIEETDSEGGIDPEADAVRSLTAPVASGDVEGVPAERATLRLHAVGEMPGPDFEPLELASEDPAPARKGEREVVWADSARTTPIYQRGNLRPGNVVDGPAVIEATDTTITVPPSWSFRIDEYDHGVLE